STTPPPAGQASTISTTLFSYNDLGEQVHTALDLNDNGQIDLDTDRVQSSYTSYQTISSDYWRVSTSVIYPEDNSATPLTNAISRTRLTGLGTTSALGTLTSENVSIDILGNETVSQTWTDRDAKKITQVTTIPTSTNTATQVTVNGVTISSESPTGVAMTYSYDALGRQILSLRTGDPQVAQSTAYDSLGRVAWVEDAASNRSAFAYDSVGRRIAVTNALGQVTHTAYDLEDRVIATWGATYPVAYEFDAFGRMTAMYTLRDNTVVIDGYSSFQSQISSFDKTTWLYDTATGLLTNKLYADGKGPTYTYTADGKLETRNWARGVVTTYTYDDCCAAGTLKSVTYSDGTPGFTNTVDRMGRVVTVTDAQGTRTNIYDSATLALIEERLPDGTVLTRSQDGFGRPSGIAFGDPSDPSYLSDYSYDPLGRFSAVTSMVANETNTFTYAYLPGADLLASVSNNLGQVAARSYETHRDLITTIENTWGTNQISRFDYTNDELARRTRRVDNGAVTNDFGYNIRSEVISAMMNTNQFGYAFDPIGNREWTRMNANTNTYAANELNQYTNIANGVTLEPAYDDDGNMVSYGDWTFTWNGENRIIAASNAAHVVTYAYDYVGRMFAKTTFETSDLETPISDLRHIWDGFNVIAEIFVLPSSVQTNWNVWGLDLSQTLQGAGGVGGLLSVTISTNSTTSTFSTAFDANGNITEYIDATGAIIAHREYSPFGETTALSGPMQDTFTHWWSTKPWDPITGFSEYEFRMYSPELGRWVNRDPIEEEGGLNLYGHSSNGPVNGVDAHGLEKWEAECNVIVVSVILRIVNLDCEAESECRRCGCDCFKNKVSFRTAMVGAAVGINIPLWIKGSGQISRYNFILDRCSDGSSFAGHSHLLTALNLRIGASSFTGKWELKIGEAYDYGMFSGNWWKGFGIGGHIVASVHGLTRVENPHVEPCECQ
ncbi:MAG: RHS repeat-associated core domain-containing protein, partial [Desulfuromonadales bacterium]|nr:RHS repeat-associated core domain-containing protein [Desulfuromonadales bacterium]